MKSFLICGLGEFGLHLTKEICALGHEVMVIDENEERINEVLPIVTSAQIGDSANEAFLSKLGVDNFDICLVTMADDFQSSLETTSLLKDLGAKFVVARAKGDIHAKFLLRNGADEIMYPEKLTAKISAIKYSSEHIFDYFEIDKDSAIFEVDVPKEWDRMEIGQLDIRRRYQINILAVKTEEKTDSGITADTVLRTGERILVLGKYDDLKKCFKL